MSDNFDAPFARKYFRFVDIFVLVFFLSIAVYGLYLFRADLMHTIEIRDEEPAGFIEIRNNIVQRRHDDRVLWDRIFVDSPIYSGDLIRAAYHSSARVYVQSNSISLNENTLIRVQVSRDGTAPVQIELMEGNLSVTSDAEGAGLILDIMGVKVQTDPGAAMSAEVTEEGMSIQVSEGTAAIVGEEGQRREIPEGVMVSMDESGVERAAASAVVTYPPANARYLKSETGVLPVDFAWNRMNIADGESLRLEIAGNRNFSRDYFVMENIYDSARVSFDAGSWYWRLSHGDKILNRGHFIVADASGVELLSPVMGSLFRYYDNLPQIRFQWMETQEASGYILEIGKTPDMLNPELVRRTSVASFIYSGLEAGTWYWRVKSVFPAAYKGESGYSSVSSFSIEKTAEAQTAGNLAAIEIPSVRMVTVQPERRTAATVSVSSSAPAPSVPPSPAPAPTAALAPPVTSASPSAPSSTVRQPAARDASRYYTVQSGDTLVQISRAWYRDGTLYMRIAEENNIANPDLIEVNQVLYIPSR